MLHSFHLSYNVRCRLSTEEQTSGPFYSNTTRGTILNLSKATAADSGIYTCIATNIFGSASESTMIIIQGRTGTVYCATCLDVSTGPGIIYQCNYHTDVIKNKDMKGNKYLFRRDTLPCWS